MTLYADHSKPNFIEFLPVVSEMKHADALTRHFHCVVSFTQFQQMTDKNWKLLINYLTLVTFEHITIILPVVLYGCETWSLTLREEQRLRMFENRVLRGIFGPKGDEVTGEWRKLHSGELHNLYSSPDIIRQIKSRRMRWARHVARMGEGRNLYGVLVGKPEGKRSLGRPRRR
jgi:hypothetical protein